MRVLLSTIGSRGDVQPLVALALALRDLGQEVHLCVPPDFRDWIESLGMPITPIGPELRSTVQANPSAAPPTPEQRRQMIEGTVATQSRRSRQQLLAAISSWEQQPSRAQRIHHLAIGTAHAPGTPTTDSLTSALLHALQPDVAARAQSIATAVCGDGALLAAQRLISLAGQEFDK